MNVFTDKQLKTITDRADSIGEHDKNNIEEAVLRDMIYKLGCYVYRQYHGVGYAVDDRHPSVFAEKRVWCQERYEYIPESQLAEPAFA